jgi:hypothetical protein
MDKAAAGRQILHDGPNFTPWAGSNNRHGPLAEAGMAIEKLERDSWHGYFDALSKVLTGKEAEIDVNALDIGAQIEAEYSPLLGIVYDHRNDILEVLLDGMDHMIADVREIYIDHDGISLNSVNVIDANGVQQIIRLRDPAMLPPPPSRGMESYR